MSEQSGTASESRNPKTKSTFGTKPRIGDPILDGIIDMQDPIGGANRDAKILIAFAAQSSLNVSAEKVTALIETAGQLEADSIAKTVSSPNDISKFWNAYDCMAVAMFPLSAHSIRSSMRINARSFPKVLISPTTVNAILAVFVFGMFLALQSFWVAGKDLIERADGIEKEKGELQQRMKQNASSIRRGEIRLDAITQEICTAIECDEFTDLPISDRLKKGASASRLAELKTQYKVAKEESETASLQAGELNNDLKSINERSHPLESLLTRWHERAAEVCGSRILSLLCPMKEDLNGTDSRKPLSDAVESMRKELANVRAPNDSSRPRFLFASMSNLGRQRELTRAEQRLTEFDADRFRSRVLEARLLIGNIGTYFIALIMGLLGALTYILRSVSQQLKDHTYVPVSVSLNVVRVCLGAIVGVFGSMLLPNSDMALRSLPPLIIPFIFGYGIEILFSLLDKIVKSFTQSEATPGSAKSA